MRAKAFVFVLSALLLGVWAVPLYANDIPPLPHAFYGELEVNGSDAEPGYTVEARGEGVTFGIEGNPILTTEVGWYGSADPLGVKLIVQGDILDGATITFYVNDVAAEPTAKWHSGDTTPVGLSVDIEAPEPEPEPAPAGGGGVGVAPIYTDTNLFGTEERFRIDRDGEIGETIEATSEDGMLTITIPEGTIALDEDGNPLSTLEVMIDESPPPPPEDAYIIGLVYDFGPAGATFDPPITITYIYDPAEVPEDVAEEDLVLAHYHAETGEWVECECACDPGTHCVTASVSHFTCFAIITPPIPAAPPVPPALPAAFTSSSLSISPLKVDIGETVTISVLVSNISEEKGSYTITLKINGVVEATKEITLAGSASETVTFTTARDKAGAYSVDVDGLTGSFTVKEAVPPEEEEVVPEAPAPEVKPAINWPVLGGVIAAVVVVGLLIFFLVRRRAY